MRLNAYIAKATGISRRQADRLIDAGRVTIDGQEASLGREALEDNLIAVDGRTLKAPLLNTTVMLNKPAGCVVSRNGQGSPTIYSLLPSDLINLKPVGRLDKDSTGLLLLTNNGLLHQQLTHPKYNKQKIYQLVISRPLTKPDEQRIAQGVTLKDGLSQLELIKIDSDRLSVTVGLSEGRNRQIRRTLATLGYNVVKLHRTDFGDYKLGNLKTGKWQKA